MKKALTLLFIISTVTSFSQKKQIVPGYRGLKFSAKYDFGLNVSWLDYESAIMPVMFHNAELAYVVSRKHELSVRYSRTDFKSSSEVFKGGDGVSYYVANAYIPIEDYTYTSNSASLICKYFATSKGYIAPVGRYTLVGVNYIHGVHQIPYSHYETVDGLRTLVGWGKRKITTHDLYITIGLGRNFILANRLILSIEGNANLPATGLLKLGISSSGDSPFVFDVNTDNMLKNLFQFKIGLGILAF
jgi:hypothetical protein